jgi:hypothetical protein
MAKRLSFFHTEFRKRFFGLNKEMPKKLLNIHESTWLDKATFPKILGVWLAITIIFGLAYFFLANDYSHLTFAKDQTRVNNLVDCIYFSFVAATTTGFGDIVPTGFFKGIAVVQVVIGLLLLALVTSRLVSIKQDAILTELYDISFKEKINRLRSSLLLFRQSIDRANVSLEEKSFKGKDLKNIDGYLTSLDYVISEIKVAIDSNKSNKYTKDIDPVSIEILFNSTLNSFEKFLEMVVLFEKEKLDWRKEVSLGLITKCLSSNDSLFESLNNSGLSGKTVKDLESRKKEIKEKLREIIYE